MPIDEKELPTALEKLIQEQKDYHEKGQAELKALGTASAETKAALEKLQKQIDEIEVKAARGRAEIEGKSLHQLFEESDGLKAVAKAGRNFQGEAHILSITGKSLLELEQKTTITEAAAGLASAGVIAIERMPGIVQPARRVLRIRDIIPATPTQSPLIYFVKVSSDFTKPTSPVYSEGSAKIENAVTFTTAQATVRTLASWVPASREILDDMGELENFIRTSLPYYVNQLEEDEILNGDNTGAHLNGLTTQAQDYDVTLTPDAPGWTRQDIIARAVEQIQADNELDPSFFVVNPLDYWSMRLEKDSVGHYLWDKPDLWGLTPVVSGAMTSGYFLVGNGDPAASQIRDRMAMEIAVSNSHSDYFTKNLIAIRAEKRVTLVVQRPDSFVYGAFTTSPSES